MPHFDFDKVYDRRGTDSLKWDTGLAEVLPMWVADMDFRTAPGIIEALHKRVEHGIFGYATVPERYYQALTGWYLRRYGFHLEPEWVSYTTGVVPALSAVIMALTDPGDKVIVQEPVYNCFFLRSATCVARPSRTTLFTATVLTL